ncbi:MAG: helix-turn-helix transcriptional regulator [Eubacteriales bacterium]|nr:helix-turn-helix transcriptional regulator [Eubacteriales bacterium]
MPKNLAIKVARAEKDMTQKALAEAVGVSRQTMNAIEKGEYNPTIKLCRAICRVLGKTLDELFWEECDNEKE